MLQIIEASTDDHITLTRNLFREYEAAIGIDLSFQDFASELHLLPGKYAAPSGGLFIAFDGESPVGCVALRPLDDSGVAELKRLYVRPAGRGKGVGLALTQHAIRRARQQQYQAVRLDTLSTMPDAQRLYRKLGFREIPPYTFNPLPDVTYMELDLRGAA